MAWSVCLVLWAGGGVGIVYFASKWIHFRRVEPHRCATSSAMVAQTLHSQSHALRPREQRLSRRSRKRDRPDAIVA